MHFIFIFSWDWTFQKIAFANDINVNLWLINSLRSKRNWQQNSALLMFFSSYCFYRKLEKIYQKTPLTFGIITENIDIIFLWNNIFLRSVKIQLSSKVKIKMIGVFNKNLLFSSSFFSVFTSKIWTEIDMIKISALNIFSTVPNFLEL